MEGGALYMREGVGTYIYSRHDAGLQRILCRERPFSLRSFIHSIPVHSSTPTTFTALLEHAEGEMLFTLSPPFLLHTGVRMEKGWKGAVSVDPLE